MQRFIQFAALLALASGCQAPPRRPPAALPRHDPAIAERMGQRRAGHLFEPELRHLLDDPGRDAWQKPEALVAALGLHPGDTVADIGAGSGYLLEHLARAVGPTGTVIAQDIQPAMIRLLRERSRQRNLRNVRVIPGQPKDPGLPTAAVDVIVLLTVYHEVTHPLPFLRALRRALRPDGRLAIIDFGAYPGPGPGPEPEQRVPEETVVAEAEQAGLVLERRHDFLPYQYYLVFRPARPGHGRGVAPG